MAVARDRVTRDRERMLRETAALKGARGHTLVEQAELVLVCAPPPPP